MIRLLEEKEVRTRKPHNCEWCGEFIQRNTLVYYRSYIFEENPPISGWERFHALKMRPPISGWMHLECKEAMDETPNHILEQGWMPGAFNRGESELA